MSRTAGSCPLRPSGARETNVYEVTRRVVPSVIKTELFNIGAMPAGTTASVRTRAGRTLWPTTRALHCLATVGPAHLCLGRVDFTVLRRYR